MQSETFEQEQKHYCPICQLQMARPAEDHELDLVYKVKGKQQRYSHGWNACPRCLMGAEKCVIKFFKDRYDKGISLKINRDQSIKLQNSGCGCGA